ncbi:hypothetical protein [Sphaerochaeta globosa]|uniref:Lipoprotein n=1 Tax=Sphaerochaeta globosa (strain ATCC BAA-1886 / DSM 22777 / Buddy) TaxID=158189 RepID=F0RRG6_SPHGB|nr:hypothetical protein [Sphaerochaeta globosa]ADY14218.1 hypothetical protein SpiBuddy_2404 [Sphaerochaeta globosa str. Buddy]
MKCKVLLILIAAVLLFGGCSKNRNKENVEPVMTVVLGMDGIPQPEWVNNDIVSAQVLYVRGYGKMSDRQISIKRATAEAKSEIAEWVSTKVKETLVNYITDTGNRDNQQALDAIEVISGQVAEATLNGVVAEDLWADAEGGISILFSLSISNVEKAFAPAAEAVAEAFMGIEKFEVVATKMKDDFSKLISESDIGE